MTILCRQCAAEPLRRRGASRPFPDRGADRSRARGDAVRERRLGDARRAGPVRAHRPAPERRRRSHPPVRVRAVLDPIAPHVAMMEEVFARPNDFDVLHFHTDYLGYSLARRHPVPYLTTMHGRLDTPELEPIFRTFPAAPLVP